MGKISITLAALLAAGAATAPAVAQDVPAAEKQTPAASAVPVKAGGAVSSSYARCAPGAPIKGVIVKGSRAAEPESSCPATDGTAEDPPAALEAKPATNQMPSRLSMTPTTARTTAPATGSGKSISEKGVSASKPH